MNQLNGVCLDKELPVLTLLHICLWLEKQGSLPQTAKCLCGYFNFYLMIHSMAFKVSRDCANICFFHNGECHLTKLGKVT